MATKRDASQHVDAPPAKRLKSTFTSGEVIIVVIGKGIPAKSFTLHKDLVCATSTFFRAATSGQWSESADKTVRLPEHPPYCFQLYLEWLYGHSTDLLGNLRVLRPARKEDDSETRCGDETYYMAKIWILGDFLGDCTFKNAIMKALLRMGIDRGGKMTELTFRLILRECPLRSGLYRWLLDMSCALLGPSIIDLLKDSAPAEFWHDMLSNYMLVGRVPLSKSFLPTSSQIYKYEEQEVSCKDNVDLDNKEKANVESRDRGNIESKEGQRS